MAALTDEQRAEVWRQWMNENGDAVAISKATLRSVVNAVDDLFENSMSAFNNAIVNGGGDTLTAAQRRRLARLVILKRFG